MWPFKKKNKVQQPQHKLTWLVRGIMASVQSASDVAGQQHFDLIKNNFEADENGVLTPIVTRIKLSDDKYIDVPLICMTNPSSYKLSKMEIEMFVKLKDGEIKNAIDNAEDGCNRCSYHIEIGRSKSKDAVKIKMSFKSNNQEPEALSRMLEELQNAYMSSNDGKRNINIWKPKN